MSFVDLHFACLFTLLFVFLYAVK